MRENVRDPQGGVYNLARRHAHFTRYVEPLMMLMGSSRVRLMHRDMIDLSRTGEAGVRAEYDSLATFLNVDAFPANFVLQRRNVRKRDEKEAMTRIVQDHMGYRTQVLGSSCCWVRAFRRVFQCVYYLNP